MIVHETPARQAICEAVEAEIRARIEGQTRVEGEAGVNVYFNLFHPLSAEKCPALILIDDDDELVGDEDTEIGTDCRELLLQCETTVSSRDASILRAQREWMYARLRQVLGGTAWWADLPIIYLAFDSAESDLSRERGIDPKAAFATLIRIRYSTAENDPFTY